jgi:hypothetical protein
MDVFRNVPGSHRLARITHRRDAQPGLFAMSEVERAARYGPDGGYEFRVAGGLKQPDHRIKRGQRVALLHDGPLCRVYLARQVGALAM